MIEKLLKLLSTKQVYGTLIIIAVTYIMYKILNAIVDKIVIKGKNDLETKRRKTLVILFNNILKYVLLIFMVLYLLNLYGVNTTSLIAGLGVAGVVIGLGLQDALKDIIGGINIIMDNYFVVGDIVTYNDFTGTIIAFGLKTTKIKKLTGEVLILANRNIDKIINISQEKATVVIQVPTAYEEDSDKVEIILKSILKDIKENNKDIEKVEYLGIESLENSCINYSIRFTCKRGTQWDLKREALKKIKKAYDKNNIKIPYNQLEVHNGTKI